MSSNRTYHVGRPQLVNNIPNFSVWDFVLFDRRIFLFRGDLEITKCLESPLVN